MGCGTGSRRGTECRSRDGVPVTITIIGSSANAAGLDNVITHEVGHNWFYGMLGKQ